MTSISYRVLSGDDDRFAVIKQDSLNSRPSLFGEFFAPSVATFVDKTLALEAFLRHGLRHHNVHRPRRSGKTYTLSMFREFLKRPQLEPLKPDISNSRFKDTRIALGPYEDLVAKHFQQYPVLCIDLKCVNGTTFEEMLNSFDAMVRGQLYERRKLFRDGVLDQEDIDWYEDVLQHPRRWSSVALQCLSRALQTAYKQSVVVLIDEYDAPMHGAIEYGYGDQAGVFFANVFGALLKSNTAVCASMMVGICKTARSGWMSELNNIEVFPMHAKDDRYANFFLFTEEEVELLCEAHGSKELDVSVLRRHYNGYTARGRSGPVRLFNPLSVIEALENNEISDYWVETGRYSFMTQNLWRESEEFRADFDLLMTQAAVPLTVDEFMNFKSLNSVSDGGLWGLLYYAGYLTVHEYKPSLSACTFRIPTAEVTAQWHQWLRDHLRKTFQPSLLDVREIITNGEASKLQLRLTAFLQQHLSLFCAPRHHEKVYQALCYMLFFLLPDYDYEVKMEQDGRSGITAHPQLISLQTSFVFEIKMVTKFQKSGGKRMLKSADLLKQELENATVAALQQIEDRRYRAKAPSHTTKLHEYGFAFAGKFCIAAVRTFNRDIGTNNWREVSCCAAVVPEGILETVLVDDEMNVDE